MVITTCKTLKTTCCVFLFTKPKSLCMSQQWHTYTQNTQNHNFIFCLQHLKTLCIIPQSSLVFIYCLLNLKSQPFVCFNMVTTTHKNSAFCFFTVYYSHCVLSTRSNLWGKITTTFWLFVVTKPQVTLNASTRSTYSLKSLGMFQQGQI